MEDFSKPKIVYQELSQGSTFAMDNKGEFMVSNTAYILTGIHLDYLIKVLNSNIVEYAYRNFYATMLGQLGLRWLAQHISYLPIPLFINTPLQNKIKVEGNVDKYVAELYGLSQQELLEIID